MGFALVGRCDPAGNAGGLSALYSTISGGSGAGDATEVDVKSVTRVAGTFSNFTCYANNIGTGRVARFRKNTANGNQVINLTDITTGVYTDAVNTDAVGAGDLFDLSTIESVGATTWYWFDALFKATIGHACYYFLNGSTGTFTINVSGGTGYIWFAGQSTTNGVGTESFVKATTRVGGTVKNFQLYVVSNAAAVTDTFAVRINGVTGTCSIPVGSGLTGLFEDTTHTDAFNSGDTLNYRVVTGASVSARVLSFIGCCIVSATSPVNDIFSGGSVTRAASATLHYFPFIGAIQGAITAEDNTTAVRHQFPCQTSKMRIVISANTYAANATMQFRKNLTTNGAQVATITAGLTGLFEDTTHTDTLAVGDDIAFSITGGTSGSITIRSAGLLEQDMTVVAAVFVGALPQRRFIRR